MHITDFHDALSITAHDRVADHLHRAARETIIAEAGRDSRHRRGYLAGIGHLLVGLGEWLQAAAQRPTAMEETV